MIKTNINQSVKNTCQQLGFPQEFVDSLDIEAVLAAEKQQKTILAINSNYSGSIDIHSKLTDSVNKHSICVTFDNPVDFLEKRSLFNQIHEDSFCFFNLIFDNNFKFVSFSLPYCFHADHVYNEIEHDFVIFFKFDIDNQLIGVETREFRESEEIPMISKSSHLLMPIADELLLVEFLRYKYSPEMIELIPEFTIPAAYDFTSADLDRRIQLARMIKF
jgi:hypothetical protein